MVESAKNAAYRAATGLSRGELAALVALVTCPGVDILPATRREVRELLGIVEGFGCEQQLAALVRVRLVKRIGTGAEIAYVPTEKGRRRAEEWAGRFDCAATAAE